MATSLIHKKSSTAGSAPTATDLQPGELALNLSDKKIYSKDTSGNIIEFSGEAAGVLLYAEKPVAQTTPSATGNNSLAFGSSSVSSGVSSVSFGEALAQGDYSIAINIQDNTNTYGALGFGSIAMGENSKADNIGALSIGESCTASGEKALAIGESSIAAGFEGFALGSQSEASGYRAFAAGFKSISSGSWSFSIGPREALASGHGSMAIGRFAEATGRHAVCISSTEFGESVASGEHSFAIGNKAEASIIGKMVYSGPNFGSLGDAQTGTQVLFATTLDGSSTISYLTSNGQNKSDDNQICLAPDSALTFSGTVIAREDSSDGSEYASWEIKGVALRDTGLNTIVLGYSTSTKTFSTTNASSWAISILADTSHGAITIRADGESSTNIRWVASIQTSEVKY